jgi:molybdate transport system substrate-binding protein
VTRALIAWLLLALPSSAAAQERAARPRVAAASDLQFALEEIAGQFTRETGESVDLVFSSSGTLARQMIAGAPFDLFLSADEALVLKLADAGLTVDAGTPYARGRIVLFAPTGSRLRPENGMAGLRALLTAGAIRRFAIANPDHAPYGKAAEAALRAHGAWDLVRPRLVLAENVSQAAQFAASGNAEGGIVAYSLTLAPALAGRGSFWLIPETDHAPLQQRMVLLKRAGPAAVRFYRYLQEGRARATLERYGFARPR